MLKLGLGLREVIVFDSQGARLAEATVSGRGGLQLAVGDGDLDTFTRLDRRVQ